MGKTLSEISNDEIKQLVSNHIKENQNLEYKLTINYKCIEDKYEVLCDIVSLVNAGGGYLIVGIRDDGNGKALRFESVEEPDRLVRSINDLCVEHISERIEGIEWEIRDIDDSNIVVYRIPESTKVPHMVTIKNNTHFLTRYTDGKREMTIGEIKHFFNSNFFSKRLTEIEAGIKELLQKGSSERKIEMMNMPINEQISDLDVDDGKILAEASYKRFISSIGSEPFFRISILPINAKRDLIDVDTPEVTNLIKNPPNQRESGWNMDGSYSETERFSEGLFRKGILNDTLILKQNGFMEFSKKIDNMFCWGQTEDEFKKRPRLYPYPVIEYPLSFLKLYKLLVSRFNKETPFIVSMGYFNIKGYVLYPGHPSSIEFKVPRNYISPYQKENLTVTLLSIDNNFNPDEVILDLVRFVYNAFGYTDDRIPFYDKQRRQFQIL